LWFGGYWEYYSAKMEASEGVEMTSGRWKHIRRWLKILLEEAEKVRAIAREVLKEEKE